MRVRFWKKPGQPRNSNGTFGPIERPAGGAPTVPQPHKVIDAEVKKMDSMAELANSMGEAAKSFAMLRENINSAVGGAEVAEEVGAGEFDGILGALEVILPHIGPYIGPYIPGLIEKYAGVKPVEVSQSLPPSSATSTPSPSEPSVGGGRVNIQSLLKGAAKVGPKGVKAALALPGARDQLEKGIAENLDMELKDLKKAMHNISEAL